VIRIARANCHAGASKLTSRTATAIASKARPSVHRRRTTYVDTGWTSQAWVL
jgi:hypothetical protein